MSYSGADDLLKLAADLDQAAPRVGREVSAAVKKSAEAVKRTAQGIVPKRTGDLGRSIGADLYGDGRSVGMTAVVGPQERYGRFVESGTAKMAPHPYMQPAFDAEAPKLEAAIAEIAGRVLS